MEPDSFRRICQFLLDRHGGPTQHIHDVARELAFMARHHVKLPDTELEKLRRMCRRLRIKRTGPTATVRKRLAVIEEPGNLHRLLLPTELMKLAGKLRRAPLQAARMAQTAVAIELLLMTAIRRKNLAGLRLGRHVLLGNDPRQPKARIVHRSKGTCGNDPTIGRAEIERRVLDGLKHRLLAPELFETFAEAYLAETQRLLQQASRQRDGLTARLAEIERKLAAMIRAIEDGLYQPSMKQRMAALEADKAALLAELKVTPSAPPVALHPSLPQLYRKRKPETTATV